MRFISSCLVFLLVGLAVMRGLESSNIKEKIEKLEDEKNKLENLMTKKNAELERAELELEDMEKNVKSKLDMIQKKLKSKKKSFALREKRLMEEHGIDQLIEENSSKMLQLDELKENYEKSKVKLELTIEAIELLRKILQIKVTSKTTEHLGSHGHQKISNYLKNPAGDINSGMDNPITKAGWLRNVFGKKKVETTKHLGSHGHQKISNCHTNPAGYINSEMDIPIADEEWFQKYRYVFGKEKTDLIRDELHSLQKTERAHH